MPSAASIGNTCVDWCAYLHVISGFAIEQMAGAGEVEGCFLLAYLTKAGSMARATNLLALAVQSRNKVGDMPLVWPAILRVIAYWPKVWRGRW